MFVITQEPHLCPTVTVVLGNIHGRGAYNSMSANGLGESLCGDYDMVCHFVLSCCNPTALPVAWDPVHLITDSGDALSDMGPTYRTATWSTSLW
jgi:hypothetical protein